eukprot:4728336-Lingulodinium_polyedra.AAC.1
MLHNHCRRERRAMPVAPCGRANVSEATMAADCDGERVATYMFRTEQERMDDSCPYRFWTRVHLSAPGQRYFKASFNS